MKSTYFWNYTLDHWDLFSSIPLFSIGLTKGLFLINLPCKQADYFTAPDYSGNDKPGLSYLCEAKPLKSGSNTYCHFPFVYNNVQYTSCSMEPISGFNPNGKPWCATEVM